MVTTSQANILSVLACCDAANMDKLQVALKLACPKAIRRDLRAMMINGLVKSARAQHGGSALVYWVTDDGRDALREFRRQNDAPPAGHESAPKSTRSIFGDVYVPQSSAYNRNDGHARIASRGMPC